MDNHGGNPLKGIQKKRETWHATPERCLLMVHLIYLQSQITVPQSKINKNIGPTVCEQVAFCMVVPIGGHSRNYIEIGFKIFSHVCVQKTETNMAYRLTEEMRFIWI